MVAFGRALSEALRRVLSVCGWCFHGDPHGLAVGGSACGSARDWRSAPESWCRRV